MFSTSYHSQTNGQTEETNKTLGTILRTLVQKNLREWDLKLGHVEFAYNKSPSLTTKISPFECIFGINPLLPIALIDLLGQDIPHKEVRAEAESLLKIHKSKTTLRRLT